MIQTVAETGSTNADLIARIAAGDYVREGEWLVADRQTAGRGRLDREWQDGAGNFMGSTVVQVRSEDPSPETLALLAGLAVHEVIAPRITQSLTLKWPNDVLVESAKLAGILLERSGDAVIVGIGVNLASAPDVPDRATIALSGLGVDLTRDAFADLLQRQFATELDRWRSFGLPPIVARWLAAGHAQGTRLSVDEPDGARLEGSFVGLTDGGALQLRLADGSTRVIHAGEVRIA